MSQITIEQRTALAIALASTYFRTLIDLLQKTSQQDKKIVWEVYPEGHPEFGFHTEIIVGSQLAMVHITPHRTLLYTATISVYAPPLNIKNETDEGKLLEYFKVKVNFNQGIPRMVREQIGESNLPQVVSLAQWMELFESLTDYLPEDFIVG